MSNKSPTGNEFGNWLKRELTRQEMIPAEFARRVGATNGQVSNWIRGNRHPTPRSIDKIADALGVDIDYVLSKAGHRPPLFEVDPESPEGQLVPLIRKVVWTEERLEAMKHDLRFYIDRDNENRKRAERSGPR